jgi:molybdopterin-containing oxidoreductase family molybdopterin binding subunit
MADLNRTAIKEDKWVYTTCHACYACCPTRVHVVNGIPVKVEGVPEASTSRGSVCAKAQGALTIINDPNRINKPLKRTNPKKGLYEDPGWVEISWEEAYDIITTKLTEIYKTDGRAFKANTMPSQGCYCQPHIWAFSQAMGSPNQSSGAGGMLCGNAAHFVAGLTHGSWSHTADLKYCNYVLHFGASKGHAAGHSSNQMMRSMADARARGMKQVIIDPICNFPGAKASRWIPIIPGTDIAVILAMMNVILNEIKQWDDVFIKTKTNGAYLIGPDGHYIRDPKSKKPLVWDAKAKKAKTWDDKTIKEFAIEGEYKVNGKKAVPGFQLLREHVKTYTPEYASKLSSVPADVIRTISREFVTEARIGSTIMIDGKSYPLRPVAAIGFSGLNNHRNAFNSVAGVHMLNMLVGAMDVPGGCLGWPTRCFGYEETGRPYYEPSADPLEGMLIAGWWWGEVQRGERLCHTMWPVEMSSTPEDSLGLRKLFSWSNDSPFFFSSDRDEAHKKIGPEYFEAKAWMNFGNNMIMSGGNLSNMEDTLKRIPFYFTFDVYLTEITYFCDVVLPDTSFFESLCVNQNLQTGFNGPVGMNDWSFHIRQPVIEPSEERRGLTRVLLELARRMGPKFYADYLHNLTNFFGLEGKYKLAPKANYTLEDISDNVLKNFFGEKHDLKWFKKNGGLHWPKKADEVYWRYEIPARVPLYWEFVQRMGESAKAIAEPRGFHMQWEQYSALPTYFATAAHLEKNPDFDFYTLIYRDTLHTGSNTQMHPELDALAKLNPYSYYITINEDTGIKKGLKNGQMVWVESPSGRKIKGPVSLIKGIHPQMMAFCGICGHWSKYLTIGKGEGPFFNDLLEIDKDHVDPVSLSADSCLKVKIYPAKEEK